MSIYREHIEPEETAEQYIARIEREKREEALKRHPKAPPAPLPATPIAGHPMAPMGVYLV